MAIFFFWFFFSKGKKNKKKSVKKFAGDKKVLYLPKVRGLI